ncbi:hypothetical protein [Clostridium sp. CF012]|uniref:hypothetical protein n=1 Tax=Clostridium sp. CF012 TaxID=2843319 RepID=UPI001C0E407C|nr:hypothetical protein [Clostridium sp. CF012]MBU3146221.1 hypothetical protein [Clostridium sp. CF012]
MGINYFNIIAAVINFAIIFAIIIMIYKAIGVFKNFINRNKRMEKKIDIILSKVEGREDNV